MKPAIVGLGRMGMNMVRRLLQGGGPGAGAFPIPAVSLPTTGSFLRSCDCRTVPGIWRPFGNSLQRRCRKVGSHESNGWVF